MTSIAIIGASQTGASGALALAKQGVEVTLYSDRSQHSLKHDVPATGTAVIFGDAQQAERHLGLRSSQDVAPVASGMSMRIVAEPDVELIAFDGAFSGFTAEGLIPASKPTIGSANSLPRWRVCCAGGGRGRARLDCGWS